MRELLSTVRGVDTNILIRYLVEDDAEQTRLVREFMEQSLSEETLGFINHVVLAEVVWLLGKGYQFEKSKVVETLKKLLEVVELEVEDSATVRSALRDFERGSADFVDYLIARKNAAAGCSHTMTFDRKTSRHALFRLLA